MRGVWKWIPLDISNPKALLFWPCKRRNPSSLNDIKSSCASQLINVCYPIIFPKLTKLEQHLEPYLLIYLLICCSSQLIGAWHHLNVTHVDFGVAFLSQNGGQRYLTWMKINLWSTRRTDETTQTSLNRTLGAVTFVGWAVCVSVCVEGGWRGGFPLIPPTIAAGLRSFYWHHDEKPLNL